MKYLPVKGAIRKLTQEKKTEIDGGYTHVLFVLQKEHEEPDSFFVNDDIIEGDLTADENLMDVKKELSQIKINMRARAKVKKADKTYEIGELENLFALELSKTFTSDHNSYHA